MLFFLSSLKSIALGFKDINYLYAAPIIKHSDRLKVISKNYIFSCYLPR